MAGEARSFQNPRKRLLPADRPGNSLTLDSYYFIGSIDELRARLLHECVEDGLQFSSRNVEVSRLRKCARSDECGDQDAAQDSQPPHCRLPLLWCGACESHMTLRRRVRKNPVCGQFETTIWSRPTSTRSPKPSCSSRAKASTLPDSKLPPRRMLATESETISFWRL